MSVAIVTGAASGLGRAIALELARRGTATVVVADRSPDPREGGAPTTALIEATTGARAVFAACDVSSPAEVRELFAAADAAGPLAVLVNNAGIVGSSERLADIGDDEIARVLDVNVKGVLYCCRAAAERMAPAGAGAIVNVSSVTAHGGSARTSVYAASKGAVASLTYALAAELGPKGVRVNAVHPGMVETQMTLADQRLASGSVADALLRRVPLRRLGAPEDVARAVAFLASEDASYVTGTSTVVDGGWSRAL
jgi:NAD(P)-dependent dehydrogenase (short-subunit alcohol dehydrogenase family)